MNEDMDGDEIRIILGNDDTIYTKEYCLMCARATMVVMCVVGLCGMLIGLILLGTTQESWPLYLLLTLLLPVIGVVAIHISKQLGEK